MRWTCRCERGSVPGEVGPVIVSLVPQILGAHAWLVVAAFAPPPVQAPKALHHDVAAEPPPATPPDASAPSTVPDPGAPTAVTPSETPVVAPDPSAAPDASTDGVEPEDPQADEPGEVELEAATVDPPALPAATAVEPAAPASPTRAAPTSGAPARPEPVRRGVLVQGGLGVGRCGQDECASLKAAGWFGVLGGYRFGRVAPILVVQGGIGSPRSPTSTKIDGETYVFSNTVSTQDFVQVAGGVLLHLLQRSMFDPYVGLTLGYFSSSTRFSARVTGPAGSGQTDVRSRTHRGSLGVILGLNFRLGRRFFLGPRFDAVVPFAGRWCVDGDGSHVCTDLKNIEDFDPGQFFPRPWSFTLQLGAVL